MKSLVCRGDAAVLARGEIIGLADVVEHVELDHEMMDAVLSGLQHREAVMARIDVEEIDLERLEHVVAQPQPEHVLIEPQDYPQRTGPREAARGCIIRGKPGIYSDAGPAWARSGKHRIASHRCFPQQHGG